MENYFCHSGISAWTIFPWDHSCIAVLRPMRPGFVWSRRGKRADFSVFPTTTFWHRIVNARVGITKTCAGY
jgi:hypothetical protein